MDNARCPRARAAVRCRDASSVATQARPRSEQVVARSRVFRAGKGRDSFGTRAPGALDSVAGAPCPPCLVPSLAVPTSRGARHESLLVEHRAALAPAVLPLPVHLHRL